MAYKTTVGKVLLKHYSPASTHDFIDKHELDKKNIGTFFADLADKHPDSYERVVSDLTRAGFESATRLGSTVRLGDLLPPDFKEARFKKLNEEIEEIKARKLPKPKERDEIIDLLNKFSNDVNKELVDTGVKENKTLAKIIRAGARGSPAQYRQTILGPVAVNDNKGGILTDFIIDRSFAEGLTLPQYLAHTFGSRQASAATKLAVADAGFLGKQLSRAGMTMIVEKHDCGSHRGISVKTTDKDYLGSFLAIPVDKFNYNNEVTSGMLATLKSKGINDIIVRNPITCQASEEDHPNAVCQLCVGRREKGLPAIGSFIGVIAGTTLAEPLCIAKGTLVKMADSTSKPIENIRTGDMVMGVSKDGMVKPTKVVNTFINGTKKVRTFTFQIPNARDLDKNSIAVTCTDEHKVLAYHGRKFHRDIRPMANSISRVWSPATPTGFDDTGFMDEPQALGIGLLLGDGSIASEKTTHLTCLDPLLITDTKNYFNELNVELHGHADTGLYYFAKSDANKPNIVLPKLKELGLSGTHSYSKFIPSIVNSWNNRSILNLLSGIISTDGCITINKSKQAVIIDITSTSEKMLTGIRDLLSLRFGISMSHPYLAYKGGTKKISQNKVTGKPIISRRDCFALRVNTTEDVLWLLKNLKLVGIKRLKATEVLANDNFWIVKNKTTERFNFVKVSDYFESETFDIEVDNENHLYLLDNQLVISNSQGMLNSKHSGGSARSASSFGGFKYVNQMFNIPDTFVHEAPLAQLDGTVKEVRTAPQGGHYVVISHEDGTTEEHYVHPDLPVLAKPGDIVEPGDILSEGIPNPAKITQLKGIGEGRVYFANQIKNTFENSQLGGVNKRNFDTISKNLISHVKITNTKGIGDYLPGTVVNYHSIEKTYQPRLDSKKVRTDQAKGMFLEEPVLHYTIGTKLTNGMLDNIKKNGVDNIVVHDESPGFEPEMHRLLEVPAHEHDWMHSLYSTNLERRLIKAVNTGESSSITGPSPVPGLAYAVGFGKKSEELPEELNEECFSFE